MRAIHLEVTLILDTPEYLEAFTRFVSRRGAPRLVMSDNARTFKAAEPIVAQRFGSKWTYIVERAPHQGGAWERLVRCVKQPLRLVLKHSILSANNLRTWACIVEGIVNKRPLSHYCDENDQPRGLTPEMFLLPPIVSSSDNISQQETLLIRDRMSTDFFDRW